jgi:hypothetical protein
MKKGGTPVWPYLRKVDAELRALQVKAKKAKEEAK